MTFTHCGDDSFAGARSETLRRAAATFRTRSKVDMAAHIRAFVRVTLLQTYHPTILLNQFVLVFVVRVPTHWACQLSFPLYSGKLSVRSPHK